MLPKDKRIPRKLFKPLIESRSFQHSPHFSLRMAKAEDTRLAVSVSKKISKSAVVRNKIRRRVYSQARTLLPSLSKGFFLIMAKSGAEKIKGEALLNELALLLKKR